MKDVCKKSKRKPVGGGGGLTVSRKNRAKI